MTTLRSELEVLPHRMKHLAIDERGYPIPWFVDYDKDGKPEFRAMDPIKWARAVREKYCWVCGLRMGRYLAFVAGPMCGINRTSSEPPSHLECARWSAINCPFLANPEAIRRVDDKVTMDAEKNVAGGIPIMRNPGVAMVWVTKDYTTWTPPNGGRLLTMGEPERVEWYCRGRVATRAEVEESIAAGLPALVAMARIEPLGLQYLDEQRQRFQKWLPR